MSDRRLYELAKEADDLLQKSYDKEDEEARKTGILPWRYKLWCVPRYKLPKEWRAAKYHPKPKLPIEYEVEMKYLGTPDK